MEVTDYNRNFLAEFVAVITATALSLVPVAVGGAGPGSGPAPPSDAVQLESIPGSTVKRVILTSKAAERLGIETSKVREERIIRKQMVGGRVIPTEQVVQQPLRPSFGGFGRVSPPEAPATPAIPPGSPEQRWVVITLSKGEWDRLRKDKPARILPLATRDKAGKAVLAVPSGMPPVEDLKRSMLKLYYKVPSNEHELKLFERVRVELEQTGKDEKRKVVPYSAIYYDANGGAWVYLNPKPLVFQRQRVAVERIHDDLAVLTDGPPIGTSVVSAGAPLLYGAEVVFKR